MEISIEELAALTGGAKPAASTGAAAAFDLADVLNVDPTWLLVGDHTTEVAS